MSTKDLRASEFVLKKATTRTIRKLMECFSDIFRVPTLLLMSYFTVVGYNVFDEVKIV